MGRAVNASVDDTILFVFLSHMSSVSFSSDWLESGAPQSGVKNEQRIHAPMMPQQMCMQMRLRSVSKCTLMALMCSL